MKKRFLSVLLITVMILGVLAGCNNSSGGKEKTDFKSDGDTLTIYAWNEEFLGMLKNYYCKDKGATIDADGNVTFANGVKLNFVINPNDGGVYQQKLDAALEAEEPIDIFLIEADYAKKYVNTKYAVPVENIGFKEADYANMYEYTLDVAKSTVDGKLKGLSWQAAPGLFLYRASLAEKYLGVTSTEEMQELVKDWDSFVETAKVVAEASNGATKLLPSINDLWQVFRTNRDSAWVVDGKLTIDDEVYNFMELAKTLQTEKLTAEHAPWSNEWNAGVGDDTTLGYFFSTWGIQWTMVGNSGGSKPGEGTYGDWRAIKGPSEYYWGGTWLTPAVTTDNADLVYDIMKYYTIDTASMQKYCVGDGTEEFPGTKDYVNNKVSIGNIISDGYSFDFLGGQDHYSLFQETAGKVDTSTMTGYDQNINTAFEQAFTAYANGEKDLDTSIADFKAIVADEFADVKVE